MALNLPQFSVDARVFKVVSYLETLKVTDTLRQFRLQFPHSRVPDRGMVRRNVAKYLRHGTSLKRSHGNSDRPRSARTQVNTDVVRQALQADPMMTAIRTTIPNIKSIFIQSGNKIGS